MKQRDGHNRSTPEKDRIRAEIEAQVEEFLRKGGKIDVFNAGNTGRPVQTGSIWPNNNDVLEMID